MKKIIFKESDNNITDLTIKNIRLVSFYMRIELKREGGYANLNLVYQVNVEDLPKEKAQKLIELVAGSRVMELQQNDLPASGQAYPDAINYQLIITASGKKTSLTFTDTNAPTSLGPLLTFLEELDIDARINSQ